MQTHSAGARLPFRPGAVSPQSCELPPVLTAIFRFEQGGIFHAGINVIRIGEGGLEVPDAFEFPWVLCAVVPHMGRERLAGFRRNVISEFVALPFRHSVRRGRRLARRQSRLEPGFSAIIRPLDDLPEPRAGLRGINSVRIDWRCLEVIHLPPREKRPVYLPILSLSVSRQDKCPFPRPDQNSYSAHSFTPS